MIKKRKILIITGSRGEYGYFRPIIKIIEKDEQLEYKLIATNMHLLPEHGLSINEIISDKINIDSEIYMSLAGTTNTAMVKSLGVLLLSLADSISNEKPDFILLFGDRGEQLIGAMVGAYMNIPVAHVQAGEISGNIDGLTRHAIARFAHIHFASNQDAYNRLKKMGEQEFRIKLVGAPQLDEFLQQNYLSKNKIFEMYNFNPEKPLILLLQHPVTEQALEAGKQMESTLKAIDSLKHQTLIIFPNNDAGSNLIQEKIINFRKPFVRVERNLKRELYAGIMNAASVIVGNSSSALLEAPSFELPAVNIGRRQEGRYQGNNVINVEHEPDKIKETIIKSLSNDFRQNLKNITNPYGDGKSSERIIKILKEIDIDEKLLIKKITY